MIFKNPPTPRAFVHPEPPAPRRRILPIFLPFSGCRKICLFCNQERQTGRRREAAAPVLEQAEKRLRAMAAQEGAPLEAAFYGGTFTLLAERELSACLAFVRRMKGEGLIAQARCSTRPDAVTPAVLERLKEAGFTCLELGIQSFSSAALAKAGRGYGRESALEACALVRRSGLELVIQLMPGMPGADQATAREDVALAASLAPEAARLYPCLVLEGSGLAALWRNGLYAPWREEETAVFLAEACLTFWSYGTRIIRLGLAPQEGLQEAILAGPWRPALGHRARSLALFLLLEKRLLSAGFSAGNPPRLDLPRSRQGEFWGHGGELAPRYAALGLVRENVHWREGQEFLISPANPDV
ncbi:MAG: radical SAM protein, partial [Deltaproteobacteria bacterium]|nr:radical SAM protein [Deltaproteobacteria bacterium]